jgi:hypothetical protein
MELGAEEAGASGPASLTPMEKAMTKMETLKKPHTI